MNCAKLHTRIIINGFPGISHNTTSRAVDCVPVFRKDEAFGPRAVGFIVRVSEKYVAAWTEIAYDTFGKVVAINIDLYDGAIVRIIGAYGVSGSNCVYFVYVVVKTMLKDFLTS